MNIILKWEINALANAFYQMQGYTRPSDFDFSKATHPHEKLVWQQAKMSFDFWVASKDKKPKKKV